MTKLELKIKPDANVKSSHWAYPLKGETLRCTNIGYRPYPTSPLQLSVAGTQIIGSGKTLLEFFEEHDELSFEARSVLTIDIRDCIVEPLSLEEVLSQLTKEL